MEPNFKQFSGARPRTQLIFSLCMLHTQNLLTRSARGPHNQPRLLVPEKFGEWCISFILMQKIGYLFHPPRLFQPPRLFISVKCTDPPFIPDPPYIQKFLLGLSYKSIKCLYGAHRPDLWKKMEACRGAFGTRHRNVYHTSIVNIAVLRAFL